MQFCALNNVLANIRDAKTYELINNVCVCMFLGMVKSVQNFTWLVEKVSNVAILRCSGNIYDCFCCFIFNFTFKKGKLNYLT